MSMVRSGVTDLDPAFTARQTASLGAPLDLLLVPAARHQPLLRLRRRQLVERTRGLLRGRSIRRMLLLLLRQRGQRTRRVV